MTTISIQDLEGDLTASQGEYHRRRPPRILLGGPVFGGKVEVTRKNSCFVSQESQWRHMFFTKKCLACTVTCSNMVLALVTGSQMIANEIPSGSLR